LGQIWEEWKYDNYPAVGQGIDIEGEIKKELEPDELPALETE
jgi:hypothetical protein